MPKITREKFKTYKAVFDNHTERCLFKLSSQDHFAQVASPISIGKEANIFTAQKKDGTYCILKIYRVENCDFTKMYTYLRLDPRFPYLKKNRRQIIFSWVRREYRNLLKAREAGVRVPTPYAILDNIIVIELIGDVQTGEAASKVKDKPPKNQESFKKQVLEEIKKLTKVGLVHGDLSKFNILNWNEKPVFIDMSQSTTKESSYAKELLDRDLKNVETFFGKISKY